MTNTHIGLIVGLILGASFAFGSFTQFFLVLIFGALGLAIGLVLEGKIDLRGLTDRSGR